MADASHACTAPARSQAQFLGPEGLTLCWVRAKPPAQPHAAVRRPEGNERSRRSHGAEIRRAPSPRSPPMAPTCARLPGAAEEPGGAGPGARWALLAVRVAHERLSPSTAAGGGGRGATWRGPGVARAAAARSGAQPPAPIPPVRGARLPQAAVPEPMAQAERRGLPQSSLGSHSTLPAPSLRKGAGCHGHSERVKGDQSPNVPRRRHNQTRHPPPSPLPPPWSLPRSTEQPPFESVPEHSSNSRNYSPAPGSGGSQPHGDTPAKPSTAKARQKLEQGFQGRSTAPEDPGWVKPLRNLRASTHMPEGGC